MHCSKLILALFCVTFLHKLNAQNNLSEGYYVGFKKDTVRGFFNFDDLANNKASFFSNKTGSVSRTLTPNDVQKIETLDKISISTFIYAYKDQREPLFIKKYAEGNITLYKGYSLNPDEEEVFFISSTKMPLIRKISAINPKIFLNTYFKGCELGSNFSVKYTDNSLLAAITEINKCAYPGKEVVKNIGKVNKLNVSMGVKVGGFLNDSKLVGWLGGQPNLRQTVKPIVGLIVAFKISNSMSIYTGLNYFQREMVDPNPFKFDFARHCYKAPSLSLSANFLEIPFALHYELNKKNRSLIPKFHLGASLLVPTSHALNLKVTDCYSYSGYDYNTTENYNSGRANPSFSVGLGVKKILKNKSILELNAKYALEADNINQYGQAASNRYELSLSYMLPWIK
jgi:hypothetical protein